jgi:hypothetical protein
MFEECREKDIVLFRKSKSDSTETWGRVVYVQEHSINIVDSSGVVWCIPPERVTRVVQ